MKKLAPLLFFFGLIACSDLIEKPKNLIKKDQMATLVAEFAINNQLGIMNNSGNMEIGTRYILEKYHVKGDDYMQSLKYYISTREIDKIYDDAEQIILEKDPKAAAFIQKKIKENSGVPPFAR